LVFQPQIGIKFNLFGGYKPKL